MNIDLSQQAGFPLYFDPELLELTPGPGYGLVRSSRVVSDLAQVLLSPENLPPDHLLFHLDHLVHSPPTEIRKIQSLGLSYGFTTLPPLKIGREFVKTHGHSHPPASGQLDSYPEIYSVVSGQMWLFLQKYCPTDLSAIESCCLIKMKPGDSVFIPPNHAHLQINPSLTEPSITAGLFNGNFKPEFDFYKHMGGFAYFILGDGGAVEIKGNNAYSHRPPMQILDQWQGTPFEAIDPALPLWTGFNRHPEHYGVLSHPELPGKD